MNLHELPLLASDIIILECPEGKDRLTPNQEIGFFLDGDQWFIRQDVTVKPVILPGKDKHFFEGLARRRETLWILTRVTRKQVFVTFLAPSERVDAGIQIGVDAQVLETLHRLGEDRKSVV